MGSERLTAIEQRIRRACVDHGRDPRSVDLLVVSKQQPLDAVMGLYEHGQRRFAENREQALRARLESDLPDDIEWHFVGPLQTNKVRSVAANSRLLHSLDRLRLAEKWGAADAPPALIQFNLALEPQKSGFDPDDADRVMDQVLAAGVEVRGVMAIPPVSSDARAGAPWFRKLRSIFDRYRDSYEGIDVCSMGMSADFEIAIEEGSTMVRIGRAIFAGMEAERR